MLKLHIGDFAMELPSVHSINFFGDDIVFVFNVSSPSTLVVKKLPEVWFDGFESKSHSILKDCLSDCVKENLKNGLSQENEKKLVEKEFSKRSSCKE